MADTYFKASDHNVKLVDLGSDRYSQAVSIENAEFDTVTDALVVMEVEHHEIHEGDFYEVPNIINITNGNTYAISILTNATKQVHFKTEKLASSGEKISIGLQEGVTIAGGSAVIPINHNRTSTKTSSVVVKTGVTLSTAGTTVSVGYIGGGTGVGGNSNGGDSSVSNEYILKTSTNYGVVIVNNGVGASTVLTSLQWYEE